jgi:hypothetical protein
MKKFILFITLTTLVINVFSQDINIKGGQILLDKVPIAKIDGKIGLLKDADLTILSLDDKPLITVKEKKYKYFIPGFENWLYVEVHFLKSDKYLIYPYDIHTRLGSEKKVVKFLFANETPLSINNNEIDVEKENGFINKYDSSAQFVKDTTDKNDYERKLIDQLKNSEIKRDKGKQIVLKYNSTGSIIYQSDVVIGKIEKIITTRQSPQKSMVEYFVYKKFETPLNVGNEALDFGLTIYFKVENSGTLAPMAIIQKKKYDNSGLIIKIDEDAQQKIADYLVGHGYL